MLPESHREALRDAAIAYLDECSSAIADSEPGAELPEHAEWQLLPLGSSPAEIIPGDSISNSRPRCVSTVRFTFGPIGRCLLEHGRRSRRVFLTALFLLGLLVASLVGVGGSVIVGRRFPVNGLGDWRVAFGHVVTSGSLQRRRGRGRCRR